MIPRVFISKFSSNKKQIIRRIAFFILLRSVYGILLLALTYLFGWELQDIREFEIFGLRVYFLILPIALLLSGRRFYRVYKWFKSE